MSKTEDALYISRRHPILETGAFSSMKMTPGESPDFEPENTDATGERRFQGRGWEWLPGDTKNPLKTLPGLRRLQGTVARFREQREVHRVPLRIRAAGA